MVDDRSIRVRLAPSPTGDVHIGTMWIAQCNWLFARQHHGTFVLRIEDTDRQRLVPGSIERIYEALEWYGVSPDEGPVQGGPYSPYIQSERLEIYRQHVLRLVEQGSAYYCFCSPERLADLRRQQAAAKRAPRYDKTCLSIPPAEAQARVSGGEPAVIRLNVPPHGAITHQDIIRGSVIFSLAELDDSVLVKSDGFPTYHLAVVVDDHLMGITHVIRAEEWLPSVPKHRLLYRAFGWNPPEFAHLPLILGSDRKKLSKRDGATSALSFRDEGYVPETMQNFLALMGWHPKGDEEVLSRAQVLREFRLEGINPSGAIFDRTKLEWLNGVYIRKYHERDLLDRLGGFWHIPQGEVPSDEWKMRAVAIVRDRLKKLSEIDELINFAFPSVWNDEVRKFDRSWLKPEKGSGASSEAGLTWVAGLLEGVAEPWDAAALKTTVLNAIKDARQKNLDVLWPLRVALSLRRASPDVFDLLALLRKSESVRRIHYFLRTLP